MEKRNKKSSKNDDGIELESFDDFIELTEEQKNALEEKLSNKSIDLKCEFFYNLKNVNLYKISKKDLLENYVNYFDDLLVFAEEIGNNEMHKFLDGIMKDYNLNDIMKDYIKLTKAQYNNLSKNTKDLLEIEPVKDKNENIILYKCFKQKILNYKKKDKEAFDDFLFEAVKINHKEMVEFLVENGVNVNVNNRYNETPLMHAAMNGNEEIIKFLVEHFADVNLTDKDGRSVLICAIKSGNKNAVEFFVENGIDDIDKVDNDDKSPLMYAAEKGNKEIVELLVSKGAEVNKISKKHRTALMYAAENGNEEIVDFLIINLAEINIKDENGRTPLMFAAISGNEEIVKLLIINGADVNKKEREVSNRNIVNFIEEKFKEDINSLNGIIVVLKERKKEIDKLGESLKSERFKEVIENLEDIYTNQNLGNIQI